MSALAAIGTRLVGGGFVNGVAQLLVNVLTGDDVFSDLALAFLCGGAGALISPS